MHFDAVYPERNRGTQCKQKGTAALFLLIGLVVALSIGIFSFRFLRSSVSPISQFSAKNSTPESQMLTYQNQALSFEFKYPKGFSVKEDSEEEYNKRGNGNFRKNFKGYVGYEPGQILGAVVVLDKEEKFDTNPFSVWVFNNDDNLTTDTWFQNYWYYPFLWGVFDWTSKGHITPDQEATISGQTTKYKVVSYQPGSPKYVYVSKTGKIYLFRVIGEVGDKILSSFKFSPSPTPTPTVIPTETPSNQVCDQVITPAKDHKTGECREFPTPCDVPEGWEKVGSCGK